MRFGEGKWVTISLMLIALFDHTRRRIAKKNDDLRESSGGLTQHARGNLDTQCTQIAKDIGAGLKVNGEAVYASCPFEVWGDNSVIYTRANSNVYGTQFSIGTAARSLSQRSSRGATLGTPSPTRVNILILLFLTDWTARSWRVYSESSAPQYSLRDPTVLAGLLIMTPFSPS
jgi:hypothetical protein